MLLDFMNNVFMMTMMLGVACTTAFVTVKILSVLEDRFGSFTAAIVSLVLMVVTLAGLLTYLGA